MKKRTLHLFIWTIVMIISITVTVLFLIPPPNEEPTEFEKELGYKWSTKFDGRVIALVSGIGWYIAGVGWIFVYTSRKNKKKQDLEKQEYNQSYKLQQ